MAYADEQTGILNMDDRDTNWVKILFDDYIATAPGETTPGILQAWQLFIKTYAIDPRDITQGFNFTGTPITGINKVKYDETDEAGYLEDKFNNLDGIEFEVATGTSKVLGIRLSLKETASTTGAQSILSDSQTLKRIKALDDTIEVTGDDDYVYIRSLSSGGVTTLLALTDILETTYIENENKLLKVNSLGTGVEFSSIEIADDGTINPDGETTAFGGDVNSGGSGSFVEIVTMGNVPILATTTGSNARINYYLNGVDDKLVIRNRNSNDDGYLYTTFDKNGQVLDGHLTASGGTFGGEIDTQGNDIDLDGGDIVDAGTITTTGTITQKGVTLDNTYAPISKTIPKGSAVTNDYIKFVSIKMTADEITQFIPNVGDINIRASIDFQFGDRQGNYSGIASVGFTFGAIRLTPTTFSTYGNYANYDYMDSLYYRVKITNAQTTSGGAKSTYYTNTLTTASMYNFGSDSVVELQFAVKVLSTTWDANSVNPYFKMLNYQVGELDVTQSIETSTGNWGQLV